MAGGKTPRKEIFGEERRGEEKMSIYLSGR